MKVSELTINSFLLEKLISGGKVTVYKITHITEDRIYFEYTEQKDGFSHPKNELEYIFETHKEYDYYIAKTEEELLALKLKVC